MTKQPWMKWRPDAWAGEKLLKLCSRQARSLWVDLIGIMHEAEPYGHLLVNGRPATTVELSKMLGDKPKEIEAWMAELVHAGVCSLDERGTVFCRRMVRDHAKATRDKDNGGKGGNPVLKAKDNEGDNKGVNPPLKARDERLETRDKKEPPASLRSDGPRKREATKGTRFDAIELPSDWEVFAIDEGIPDPRREFERFRDYWRARAGPSGVKLDWSATWRNWVRKAIDDGKSRGKQRSAPEPDGFLLAAARVRQRYMDDAEDAGIDQPLRH